MLRASSLARRLGLLMLLATMLAPISIASLASDVSAGSPLGFVDDDGDFVDDARDNCLGLPNTAQLDADKDDIGDACDPVNDRDLDEDYFPKALDNCPEAANTTQRDQDFDGTGDACDATPTGEPEDTDTSTDTSTDTATDTSTDTSTDTDTAPVTLPDSDDDGDPDNADNCPLDPNPDQTNSDGDPLGDACDPTPDGGLVPGDSDGDLQPDTTDNCPEIANTLQLDTDHDGTGDACDTANVPDGALVTVSMAAPDRVIAPNAITYEITVTSTTDDLTTAILSSELPRGDALDWRTSTPGCQILDVQGQERLMCPAIMLWGEGETFTAEVSSATEEAVCGETLSTNAIADPGQGDPVTSTQVSTEVLCQTQLTVTTTPDGTGVEPGDLVSYTFTVKNTGVYDAIDFTLTVPLLEELGVEGSYGDIADCDITDGTLQCDGALLPAGESRSVTVSGTLPAEVASCTLDLTTTATAGATNADPVSDGGSYTVICEPDLSIVMTMIPENGTATYGDTIGFVITLTNDGFGDATSVAFETAQLPYKDTTFWTLMGPEGCELVADSDTLLCTGIDLTGTDGADGGTDTTSVTVTADTDAPESADDCGTEYAATAALKAGGTGSAGATVTLNCTPHVSIAVTTIPEVGTKWTGSDIGFVITLSNTGLVEAEDVGFTDTLPRIEGQTWEIDETPPLPDGVDCGITTGTLSCTGIDLAPLTGTYAITVTSPTNEATSIEGCDPPPTYTNLNAELTGGYTGESGPASIAMTCPVSWGISSTVVPKDRPAVAGEDISYRYAITNSGFGPMTWVFTDEFAVIEGQEWSLESDADLDERECTPNEATETVSCAGSFTLAPLTGEITITITISTGAESCPDGSVSTNAFGMNHKTSNAAGFNIAVQVSCTPPETQCDLAASAAGLIVADYTVVVGTSGNDTFTGTSAKELFCGIFGADHIDTLEEGDVFLGGVGIDSVTNLNGGLFGGGDGNDHVEAVNVNSDFYGNGGDDTVTTLVESGAFFHGGTGKDSVTTVNGGIFYGEEDNDTVATMENGSFYGGENNDTVATMENGFFDGGDGSDTIEHFIDGVYLNVENVPNP